MDAAGEIDRRKVAEIVFAATPQGREELAFLEQLTHPRIKQRLQTQLAGTERGRGSASRRAGRSRDAQSGMGPDVQFTTVCGHAPPGPR